MVPSLYPHRPRRSGTATDQPASDVAPEPVAEAEPVADAEPEPTPTPEPAPAIASA